MTRRGSPQTAGYRSGPRSLAYSVPRYVRTRKEIPGWIGDGGILHHDVRDVLQNRTRLTRPGADMHAGPSFLCCCRSYLSTLSASLYLVHIMLPSTTMRPGCRSLYSIAIATHPHPESPCTPFLPLPDPAPVRQNSEVRAWVIYLDVAVSSR